MFAQSKSFSVFLILWGACAFGDDGNMMPFSELCPPNSHNPKCWEQAAKPVLPFCKNVEYCTRIKTVIRNQEGQFICSGTGYFTCTKLMAKYGGRILGLPVKVSFSQIDTCSQPGRCGARACRPFSLGVATESGHCR